jgi:hypothetical protein
VHSVDIMQTYPVDVDPKQLVRWIKLECEAAPMTFRIIERRTREVRAIPVGKEIHLGDEEREDLSEIATIARLEIAPVHASDGWLLSVIVEDEIGPRISNGDAEAGGEQQIDLGSFYNEFIRQGRGTANVIAKVADPAAKARVTHLLNAIETDRHGANRGSAGT